MYLSHEMLSNLAPREMTASEQRQADEQLGQVAAAVARWGHRLAAQIHAAATLPAQGGQRPTAFRKAGLARRRASYSA